MGKKSAFFAIYYILLYQTRKMFGSYWSHYYRRHLIAGLEHRHVLREWAILKIALSPERYEIVKASKLARKAACKCPISKSSGPPPTTTKY